jgi:hypothetical protein
LLIFGDRTLKGRVGVVTIATGPRTMITTTMPN